MNYKRLALLIRYSYLHRAIPSVTELKNNSYLLPQNKIAQLIRAQSSDALDSVIEEHDEVITAFNDYLEHTVGSNEDWYLSKIGYSVLILPLLANNQQTLCLIDLIRAAISHTPPRLGELLKRPMNERYPIDEKTLSRLNQQFTLFKKHHLSTTKQVEESSVTSSPSIR